MLTGTISKKELVISHEVMSRPCQKVGVVIFTLYQRYVLITVDCFSRYIEIDHLYDKSIKEVIGKLKGHLARHGTPDKVMADNGQLFGSYEFTNFADTYGFEHLTSYPLFPHSNGEVENAVNI